MGSASSSVQGFRVVQVLPGSPLEQGHLQSYIDFIVSANGVRLCNDSKFSVIISKSVDCAVVLKVFNILSKRTREETVIPRKTWGGSGLLGGTVRFEEWSSEDDFGVRVLGLLPGSPAEAAGLVPMDDYILGTDEVTVMGADHLVTLALRASMALPLYVFSVKTRSVRTVSLTFPEGERQLGIDAGEGALHFIENVLATPVKEEPAPEKKANPFVMEEVKQEPVQSEPPMKVAHVDPPAEEVKHPAESKPEAPKEHKQEAVKAAEEPRLEPAKVKPRAPPPFQKPKVPFVTPKMPSEMPALKDPFQSS